MLVRAFGIPTLTLFQVNELLKNLNVDYGIASPQGLQRFREPGREAQPVIPIVFTDPGTFLRRQGKFKVKIVAFVLGDPMTLGNELELPCIGAKINGLVVERTNVSAGVFKEIMFRSTLVSDGVEVSREQFSPHDLLLKKYKGSQLSVLQTLLYRIKDKEVRLEVGRAFKKWMQTNLPVRVLEKKIHRAPENVRQKFLELARSPGTANLREAMRRAIKTGKIDSTARKHKISPFDIRYLLATV